jgi:hypothetical protein
MTADRIRPVLLAAFICLVGCGRNPDPAPGSAATPSFFGSKKLTWSEVPAAVKAQSDRAVPADAFVSAEHLAIRGELAAGAQDLKGPRIKEITEGSNKEPGGGQGAAKDEKTPPPPKADPDPKPAPPGAAVRVAGAYLLVHERKLDGTTSTLRRVYLVGPDGRVVFVGEPTAADWVTGVRRLVAED